MSLVPDDGVALIVFLGLAIIVFGVIFEVGVLTYAFITADEVKCNLLLCEFSSSKSITSQDCYMNGEHIDCNLLQKTKETNKEP